MSHNDTSEGHAEHHKTPGDIHVPDGVKYHDVRSFDVYSKQPKKCKATLPLTAGAPVHFCTCGLSSNFPLCDGSHAKLNGIPPGASGDHPTAKDVQNAKEAEERNHAPPSGVPTEFQPLEWTVTEAINDCETLDLEYSKAMVLLHCSRRSVPRHHVMPSLDVLNHAKITPATINEVPEGAREATSNHRRIHRTLGKHFKYVLSEMTDPALVKLFSCVTQFTTSGLKCDMQLDPEELSRVLRVLPKALQKVCLGSDAPAPPRTHCWNSHLRPTSSTWTSAVATTSQTKVSSIS